MLLPNNTVVQQGFAGLATQFGIQNPDTFFDRLLRVADINYEPPDYHGGTGIVAGNEEAAGVVLFGFANSHVLHGAYKFYDNKTVCPSQPWHMVYDCPCAPQADFVSKQTLRHHQRPSAWAIMDVSM